MRNLARIVTACFVMFLSITLTGRYSQGLEVKTSQATSVESQENSSTKLVPLNPAGTVLLDKPGKRILLKAKVVLREGVLEMLCCPAQTKEHESVLAVDAKAYVVHTALIFLEAESGSPAKFVPKYQPPTGQKIDIFLQWTNPQGKLQRVPAQNWIRFVTRRYYGEALARKPFDLRIPEKSELRYDEKNRELSWFGQMTAKQRDELLALSKDKKYRQAINAFYKRSQPRQIETDWIFVGSKTYIDTTTGEKSYLAEEGDLICVANFPTAMIDVSIESSSQGQESLLFEPYTERIPPLGTEVTIELIPRFEKGNARSK